MTTNDPPNQLPNTNMLDDVSSHSAASAKTVTQALKSAGDSHDAEFLQGFFKTGEGQYGAGDVFLGVRVPATRQICKQFRDLPLNEIQKLLDSKWHECRLAGLIILTLQYPRATEQQKQSIYEFYLLNIDKGRINNWDLVDISAEFIVGEHLITRDRAPLFGLAQNNDVWHKRVAIVSTFEFIKQGDPGTTLEIAEILLHDTHDLIQKAVGWMLREVGKRVDEALLIDFLDAHYTTMPRTMLRYAIERLDAATKARYMKRV